MKHMATRWIIGAALSLAAMGAWAQSVRFETTEGDFVVKVDAKAAPLTVKNFLYYVRMGFYNGTIFHRVIPSFMVHGGGFTPDMQQKRTLSGIPLESHNGLSNVRGSVAMARTGEPNSATSQFFVNVVDNARLDAAQAADGHGYAVFGQVTEGMDVIDKIRAVPTEQKGMHRDVPVKPVIIKKATLEK